MAKLDDLADALVELDEERALSVAREIVAAGDAAPAAVLKVCQQAMRVVGERYERREYYLEGLIIAGEIFQEGADLGVDVTPERIVAEIAANRPDVVCLSGLITAAFQSMKATADLVARHVEDLGYSPPVILGGSTVDDRVCRFVGAESWSNDGMEGVKICRRLVEQGRRRCTEDRLGG